jgi:hypothetical protein
VASPASAATSTGAGRTPPTRARAAGTSSPAPPTSPARLALITGAGAALPADFVLLPGNTEKLALFCQGFSDRQLSLIGLENSLAAQYKENLATYRKQAARRAAAR